MKKNIFIFILINIFLTNVYASTSLDNYVELSEEVVDYNNDNINIKITIPYNYNDDRVSINSKVFDSINHFRLLDSNNKQIKVNIEINNQSKYIYRYTNDSLKIYLSNKNSKVYRTKNTAIISLFNNKNIKLEDKYINKRLKIMGYNSLDMYYLDYYNNKYKTDYKDINSFNNSIKKEIFKYTKSNTLETNEKINKMSIDYYNEKLIKLKFNNRYYSLNDCLSYYIDDSEYIYNLSSLYNKAVVSFYVELNKEYNDLFINYLTGSMYFTLDRLSLK